MEMLPCPGTGIEISAGIFRFSIQLRQIIKPGPFLDYNNHYPWKTWFSE